MYVLHFEVLLRVVHITRQSCSCCHPYSQFYLNISAVPWLQGIVRVRMCRWKLFCLTADGSTAVFYR